MNRIIDSAITTLVIALFIPCIGYLIDKVINIVLNTVTKYSSSFVSRFIYNRLTFIGVMHHELSHALFAFITGAKIIKIDLFKPQGNTLGSVTFIPRGNKITQSIQMTSTAIAPVVMGIINSYILLFKALAICNSNFIKGIIIYVIISILIHSTLSRQDIKNWLRGLPLTVIFIFILVFIIKFNITTLLISM